MGEILCFIIDIRIINKLRKRGIFQKAETAMIVKITIIIETIIFRGSINHILSLAVNLARLLGLF